MDSLPEFIQLSGGEVGFLRLNRKKGDYKGTESSDRGQRWHPGNTSVVSKRTYPVSTLPPTSPCRPSDTEWIPVLEFFVLQTQTNLYNRRIQESE